MHDMYPFALAAHACMSVASVVRTEVPICILMFHSNVSAILHHVDCDVTKVKLGWTITLTELPTGAAGYWQHAFT